MNDEVNRVNFVEIQQSIDAVYYETSNLKNMIQCQRIHKKSFQGYRNCFKGKTVVLMGAGPTAKRHKKIKDAVYVGVNNACLLPQVQFNYLFCQDFYMNAEKKHAILNYRKESCTKFFGIIPDKRIQSCRNTECAKHVRRCPKYYIIDGNAKTYYIYDLYQNKIALDIENEPLKADGIIFCALQFILHCHPSKIYIVGCDCTSGFFYESEITFDNTYMIEMWHEFKEYIDEFYSDIEIVSINPVGLKGLFIDYYDE
ncbi:hypothetical protein H8S37_17110 [Mediterraneibacter sp. NSJ-55]|uniref:Uncharacterized protein n=1 Tax=Mediterraneibacter hominis TaxID=2763054 RepID=A0A923LLW1_9FIRM|nr:hypothetical protein [Mediterraneibacter hominis]MBC5690634.1 hypothetical protein [Mediterraneibacter hominis]